MPYNRFIPSTSKDSGEEKVDESPQKYFANKDECEGKSGAEPSGSNINNFYLDRVGDQHIETDKNDESSKKNDDEGKNGATGAENGFFHDKLPERIVKLNQSSISRPAIVGLGLDEYIRKENIIAPPKHRKRKSVHQERPLTSRKLNKAGEIDPCISLDENTTISRHGRGESTTGLQQQHTEKETEQQEFLHETPTESGNGPPPVYIPYHFFQYEAIREWIPNSWEFLSILENKGIPLFWEVVQRVDFQNVAAVDQSRQFRCVVSFNHIVGVCEASKSLQAKHGAAWNFLQEFKKAIPSTGLGRFGPFPDKVDDAVLIKDSAFHILLGKMKEIYDNFEHQFYSFEQKNNDRTLFKCILWMGWGPYEGSSYIDASAAELLAIKAAYEKLLEEPCPMDQIHLGAENCTAGGGSLYRIVESQRLHSSEF